MKLNGSNYNNGAKLVNILIQANKNSKKMSLESKKKILIWYKRLKHGIYKTIL